MHPIALPVQRLHQRLLRLPFQRDGRCAFLFAQARDPCLCILYDDAPLRLLLRRHHRPGCASSLVQLWCVVVRHRPDWVRDHHNNGYGATAFLRQCRSLGLAVHVHLHHRKHGSPHLQPRPCRRALPQEEGRCGPIRPQPSGTPRAGQQAAFVPAIGVDARRGHQSDSSCQSDECHPPQGHYGSDLLLRLHCRTHVQDLRRAPHLISHRDDGDGGVPAARVGLPQGFHLLCHVHCAGRLCLGRH
mmetsp:Transcript_56866/g.149347  ORF Transcript_56866/g.149347 Transcript_56866/m.149347 type:complete len:244 (-) Transcript_56866:131-862(-)